MPHLEHATALAVPATAPPAWEGPAAPGFPTASSASPAPQNG